MSTITDSSRLEAQPRYRVLIADDDAFIRQLLEMVLRTNGFEVDSAVDGYDLVCMAQEQSPHLILVDLMMPRMDGYEAIRQMRNDTRTAHVPMLVITALDRSDDVVTGFESGADDYIVKPFDIPELLARVKSHLRRVSRRPAHNALSGLPGNLLLSQELQYRLSRSLPLALLYADLDHFKAFNDTYGFSRGDRAILQLAKLLQRIVDQHGNPDDFIGHIGGDDFVVLTTPDQVDMICRATIAAFDREIQAVYDPDDLRRGYLSGIDRYGVLRRFKLMSISIGVVTTERRRFSSEEEVTRTAAEMKQYAKTQPGSTYAIDQRGAALRTEMDRRTRQQRTLLLASDDSSLRTVLRTALIEEGFTYMEAISVEEIRRHLLNEPVRARVLIVDAQLGEPLWEFCADQQLAKRLPPMIVLAADDQELTQLQSLRSCVALRQPLPLYELMTRIEKFLA